MQSAGAAYKEDAVMSALVVHSTHELHQLKKALPLHRGGMPTGVKFGST